MKQLNKGFSLVEVLIAMAVMALGLLAVASFQTELLNESGTSKARGEALALAQQRLDEFRNYTTSINDEADFITTYATVTTPLTESITGVNAVFTRGYTITSSTTGSTRDIQVTVGWSDRRGENQNVSLNTKVAWESPRSVGDVANNDRDPLIKSTTGKATLGAGTLGSGATQMNSSDQNGTNIMREGNDIKLSLGSSAGSTVVLTLKNACTTSDNSSCTDFVKIKGKVYFDTTVNNSRPPAEVYIRASDSAYCHRYYGSPGNYQTVTLGTTTLTNLPGSANNQYRHYDYTCYMGGGWHGNIGVIFSSGVASGGGVNGNAQARNDFDANSDVVCVGDPTSSNDSFKPIVALRRVYRGMLYIHDTSFPDNNNKRMISVDGNMQTQYFTVGIGDAVILPTGSNPSHDFVVSKKTGGTTNRDDCGNPSNLNKPMTRTDATISGVPGALFAGMPDDFFCLNSMAIVDNFDSTAYRLETGCPFNPASPPAKRYSHRGQIIITNGAGMDTSSFNVSTGVEGEHCTTPLTFTDSGANRVANYSCNIYNWDATEITGWKGTVSLYHHNVAIGCSVQAFVYGTANQVRSDLPDPTNPNAPDRNFQCELKDTATITGTVEVYGDWTADISSMEVSTSDGVLCTLNSFNNIGYHRAADYSCSTYIDIAATSWSGMINLTHTNGAVTCNPNSLTVNGVTTGTPSANNDFICSGPAMPVQFQITGAISVTAKADMSNMVNGITVNASAGAACALNQPLPTSPPFTFNGNTYSATYTCNVAYPASIGNWDGTVQISPNSTRLTCTPSAPRQYMDQSSAVTNQDFTCLGPIRISGMVTKLGNRVLSGVSISDGGPCTLQADGLTFRCDTHSFNGSWSGSIRFTAPSQGTICVGGVAKGTLYNHPLSNLGSDFNLNTISIISGNNTCPP